MGHTATNVLVHFIFSTRHRRPLITAEIGTDLHAYLGGILRELGGVALCTNGMPDHVHLLVRMPSIHSVADVARIVKANSIQDVRVATRLRCIQRERVRAGLSAGIHSASATTSYEKIIPGRVRRVSKEKSHRRR